MSEEVEFLQNLSKIIDKTCLIYLISFGLVSNIISFIIYTRKVFSKQSIGTYLSWLSISNLIAILTLIENLFNNFESPWTRTLFYCKFYVYLHYINLQYCSWILVINSFDHLISVTMAFKYKVKFLQQKCYQITILLGVLVILFLVNIPMLLNSFFNKKIFGCDIYPKLAYLIDILDMIVGTLAPFFLMTISTSIILVKLFQWKNDSNSLHRRNETRRTMRKTQFARTVIGINILFLVCNLPISIILIIINHRNANNDNDSVETTIADAKLDLFYVIFHNLMYLHNASSIVVYLICNRLFRKEFLLIFCINKERDLTIKNKRLRGS